MNCEVVKNSVLEYIHSQTEVVSLRGACVMSLPFKTLDGRWVEVYIEPTGTSHDLVHDAGQTFNHLEGSGLLVSESKIALLAELANRFSATLEDGVFKILARHGEIQQAVFSIAQCCSVAMYELLKHKPSAEDERVKDAVGHQVQRWSVSSGIAVKRGVKLTGSVRQYALDFVAAANPPIAVTILVPSYGAIVSADRFALQSLDLESTGYSRWRKLAVLSSPEKWKTRSRAVVSKFADEITEVGELDLLDDDSIPEALDRLAGLAA